jgi:8-oxo-dGTP pyrophosphatase MutT (NUDIX family)
MNNYIKSIRKYIGHEPLLICGASVIILNAKNEVLMLHRSDNDSWCFPGGGVELGESAENAAVRETLEKTGLVIKDIRLFGVFSGEKLHYTYPNGDEVYIVDIVFITNIFEGEVIVDNESKTACFFHIDHLPDKISPPVIPVAEELMRRHGKKYKQLCF